MSQPLIPPTFLYRFAAPIYRREPIWPDKLPDYDEAFRLPALDGLNGRPPYVDVYAAWSSEGLAFRFVVEGKSQPPVTQARRLESSDAIGLWIDTRNTHNIHRASRYCHRFLFLPAGGGLREEQAYGCMMRIHRAKDDPKTFTSKFLPARCRIKSTGYTLDAFVPTEFLFGYDVQEHDKIGFYYAVADTELGSSTWFHGGELPFAEDPSMWGTLEMSEL